jgi:hypothetical protein
METSELLAALQPMLHDRRGALRSVGHLPRSADDILVTLAEPDEPTPGTIVVAPQAILGPAVSIGDAALAHPDGLLADLFSAIGGMREEALPFGRVRLRKLTVFVPETHLEGVREAIVAAGAGRIGRYADCTFTLHGDGSFRPLASARPYLGRPGEREVVAEARVEAVYAPYREQAILAAMRAAHPYEEIAYDIVELENPDPTYGAVRFGMIEPVPAYAVLEKVLQATGSNALFVSGGDRVVGTVLFGTGQDLASAARETQPDLVVTDHIAPADAALLLRRGAAVAELRDLEICALRHLAARLRGSLPIPVREASEGLVWRSFKYPGTSDRL